MVNHTLIEQRLVLITTYLHELDKLSQEPKESFVADKIMTAAAESYLRRSLEAIFDIGRHILAKTGSVELATEYKSIAKGLMQKAIIDAQLGSKLVAMAGYRNRMVHLYNEITDEELYSILKIDLDDIKNFVKQIRNFASHNKPQ